MLSQLSEYHNKIVKCSTCYSNPKPRNFAFFGLSHDKASVKSTITIKITPLDKVNHLIDEITIGNVRYTTFERVIQNALSFSYQSRYCPSFCIVSDQREQTLFRQQKMTKFFYLFDWFMSTQKNQVAFHLFNPSQKISWLYLWKRQYISSVNVFNLTSYNVRQYYLIK